MRLGLPIVIASRSLSTSLAQVASKDANKLARNVLSNELKSEKLDQSHWMFRLSIEKTGGAMETDEVVETKDGDLKRPLEINGRGINEAEANRRVEQLVQNPGALGK
jgi:hypothetical protein